MIGRLFGWSGAVAVVLALSLPVHSLASLRGFYSVGEKYREWFQTTVWLPDTRREEAKLGRISVLPGLNLPVSEKYPYPDKEFVMTEAVWKDAVGQIKAGDADWFDAEVVRQRAVIEGYPPAMDMLAWMYEHGRAVERNPSKAVQWYQRAEWAGVNIPSGNKYNIFTRQLNPEEQRVVRRNIADDRKDGEADRGFFAGLNLQVFARK